MTLPTPNSGIAKAPFRLPLGVLMAGGKSTRMGTDKACLVIKHQPLWKRQMQSLSAVCESVVVSAPESPTWLPHGVPWVRDAEKVEGPLAGLLGVMRGATQRGDSHLLILAVDLPQVNSAGLQALVARCTAQQGVIMQSSLGYEPLCAIYPVAAQECMEAFAARRIWKLQEMVAELVERQLLAVQGVSEASTLFNLNTPEDLAAIQF